MPKRVVYTGTASKDNLHGRSGVRQELPHQAILRETGKPSRSE